MRALSSSKTVTAVPYAMRSCEIEVVSGAANGNAMIARGARPRDLACVSVRLLALWTRLCVYPHRAVAGRAGVYRRLESRTAQAGPP